MKSLEDGYPKMEELAFRLQGRHPEVRAIVFNSLIAPVLPQILCRPMAIFRAGHYDGDYYDSYGPWLFNNQQPISWKEMIEGDQAIASSRKVHAVMRRIVPKRLVFVVLSEQSERFDSKFYRGRTMNIQNDKIENGPLNGTTIIRRRPHGIVTLTSCGRHEAEGRRCDSCVLDARLVMPDFESVRPDRAIGMGCKSMSAGMEVTVDE